MKNTEKPVVLIVDDTPDNILLLNEILKAEYKVTIATNGKKALEVAKAIAPDIILMDVMMPVMDGYEACRRLKEIEERKDIPVLFLTARSDEEDERRGFAFGAADYIVKPVSPPILLARMKTHLALKKSRDILENQNHFLDEEVQRRTKEVSVVQEASIMAMASLAEARDHETGSHLQRVKLYIKELAEYMGKTEKYKKELTPEVIRTIVLSSPLHDIGKIAISDNILLKPGSLTPNEYAIMKSHAALGRDAIACAERLMGGAETFLTCAREIAFSHHEKWDGSGYPLGLLGEEIPLPARLMAVADAYDALTSVRVYKTAISHEEAVRIIKRDSGRHFDPDIVDAFLNIKEKLKEIAENYVDCANEVLACMREKQKIPLPVRKRAEGENERDAASSLVDSLF